MGVLDKIKNALFEVEYVEVEEPPKKEKKVKAKESKEDKPIAKKIVLPGKKEDKVEEIEEEELLDEDFEIRPKDEVVVKESFKLMDDDDFKVEDDYPAIDEPEIIEEEPKEEVKPIYEAYQESQVESKPVYQQEKLYPENRENKLYGIDNSYSVQAHQYGTYERYEERTYFKPSPIISPIYGILDKNYKKEDVKEKQDPKVSSYTRGRVSVDDIRDKAYGKQEVPEEETKFETEIEEDKLMVDLSDKAKPEVKEITVGDALEYFQDLGLEYNVDYVDASAENKPKEEPKKEEKVEKKEEVIEKQPEEPQKNEEVEEIKEETALEETSGEDDNLFDLIDSMYKENS